MGSRQGTLIAGTAGVVGFLLTIIGGLIAGEFDIPEPTDDPATVVSYYQTLDFDRLYWGIAVEMLGYLLLITFSVKLAYVLGGAPRGSGWGGWLTLTGIVLSWAMTLVSYAPWLAGAYRADHGGLSDDGYLLLNDLNFIFYPLFLMAAALFLLPAGVLVTRTGLYPRWLGWAGIALAPALFLAAALVPSALRLADGLAGLWGLWLLIAAILMLARMDVFSDG